MSLSKKYCDNLILTTLFQDQIYSKDIKISTPAPCQDDGEDIGRGALRLQTWSSPQQNTNLLNQHINDLIAREHKAFLKVLLIKLTLNGSLGKNVDRQRLRTFYRCFPNFSVSSLGQVLKQANFPGHMSAWTGKILPPHGILNLEYSRRHCQVSSMSSRCPLTKAMQPGVLYTLAQCPSASILIRLWYSMQHLEMGKKDLYCGSWRKVQTRFFDKSKNVEK